MKMQYATIENLPQPWRLQEVGNRKFPVNYEKLAINN